MKRLLGWKIYASNEGYIGVLNIQFVRELKSLRVC